MSKTLLSKRVLNVITIPKIYTFFSNPCIRKAYLFNLNFLCCPNCVYNSKEKSRFEVNLFMKESDTIAPFVIRYFNLKMI